MLQLPPDIFATKGVEYLLVISFLAALILFWRYLVRPALPSGDGAETAAARSTWFHFPAEAHFHPGHSWTLIDSEGLVRIGIDDFAQKLIGIPDAVQLPAVGTQVEQGARGPSFRFGSETIDLLSPVDGEVVAANDAVLEDPAAINRDPYGAGWLLKVKPSRLRSNLGNLLHEGSTAAWMSAAEEALRARMAPGLGVVLQDGGVPIIGIARNVFGDGWVPIAKDFLLTA